MLEGLPIPQISVPSLDQFGLWFALCAGILIAIIYFIWTKAGGGIQKFFQKWPVGVNVFEKRGNAVVLAGKDKATYNAEKGVYLLRGRNVQVPAQDYKYLLPNMEINIYSPKRGVYWPVDFNLDPFCSTCGRKAIEDEVVEPDGDIKKTWVCPHDKEHTHIHVTFIPVPSDDMKYIFSNSVKELYLQHMEQSPMEKFTPLVITAVVGLLAMGMIYVASTQSMSLLASATAGAAGLGDKFVAAAQALASCHATANAANAYNFTIPP